MADGERTSTRVYKYRLKFDPTELKERETAINDELYRGNQLWNQLVDIHLNNWNDFYELRRNASDECRMLCDEIERLDELLFGDEGLYKKDLKAARQAAGYSGNIWQKPLQACKPPDPPLTPRTGLSPGWYHHVQGWWTTAPPAAVSALPHGGYISPH